MIRVASNGLEIELLQLVTCQASQLHVGTCHGDVFVWARDGRLVQALWLRTHPGCSVAIDAADGRATLATVDFYDEEARVTPLVYARSFDLVTGVLRWRRKDKYHRKIKPCAALGGHVLHIAAPHGAHLFDL